MRILVRNTRFAAEGDRRSGAALVLTALFLFLLVPVMGLAVDGTNVYIMTNQISTALHAAVLAGTRNLTNGSDAFAESVASQTFAMNVAGMNPAILWNGSTSLPGPSSFPVVPYPTEHYESITANITVTLPLMLMPILPGLGANTTVTPISATAIKRDVNLMLVLDTSNLMGSLGSYGIPLDLALNAIIPFVEGYTDGRDNVGMVSLATDPFVSNPLSLTSPPAAFKANMVASLNSLYSANFGTTGYPNTSAAMWAAYQQLLAVNQPKALNVIVLFTNNVPAAFSANFTAANFETSDQMAAQQATLPPGQNVGPVCTPPVNAVLWADQLNLYSGGLSYYYPDPVNGSFLGDTPEYVAATGCDVVKYYPSSPSFGTLVSMPSADIFGFSTAGSYQAPLLTRDPVTGISVQSILYAAANATDNAAFAVRNSAALPGVFVYAVGMKNDYAIFPDPVLMCRLANDPAAGTCAADPAQPEGKYVSADLTGGNFAALTAAFNTVASSVLQLSR